MNMGTSTMGSDLHSDKQDKLLKLQARKKELEQLLAAKNEELYKLCVQEVQLTGIMPPEAPLSPEESRERLGSIKSVDRSNDGNDVQDGFDNASRRLRSDRAPDGEHHLRKNISHRLSTPSISGVSTKSAHSRHIRRPETSCSNFFPSPPQERNPDTFSIHTSHTYPTLANRQESASENIDHSQQGSMYRHHTMTTEYMNKIYYTNTPQAHSVSHLKETHFSSSHPDITTHYSHPSLAPHAVTQNCMRTTPLLYQYASHLKAKSQHLGALGHHHQVPNQAKRRAEGSRRNSLQRTQTYHLTSHSDYNQHLETITDVYRPPATIYQHRSQTELQDQVSDRIHMPMDRMAQVPNTLPLRERNTIRNPKQMQQLQVSTDDYIRDERYFYPDALSPVSQMSGYSQGNFETASMNKFSPLSQPPDTKAKEKQWYETSLDSPTKETLVNKSSSLKRTASLGNSQAYEIMISSGRHSAMQSPNHTLQSTPVMSPSAVSLESPKNLTVIEQGKCIPYREETKPFEMSDFYKYSTKFRQANAHKPPQPNPVTSSGFNKLPMELPFYSDDQWHGQNH